MGFVKKLIGNTLASAAIAAGSEPVDAGSSLPPEIADSPHAQKHETERRAFISKPVVEFPYGLLAVGGALAATGGLLLVINNLRNKRKTPADTILDEWQITVTEATNPADRSLARGLGIPTSYPENTAAENPYMTSAEVGGSRDANTKWINSRALDHDPRTKLFAIRIGGTIVGGVRMIRSNGPDEPILSDQLQPAMTEGNVPLRPKSPTLEVSYAHMAGRTAIWRALSHVQPVEATTSLAAQAQKAIIVAVTKAAVEEAQKNNCDRIIAPLSKDNDLNKKTAGILKHREKHIGYDLKIKDLKFVDVIHMELEDFMAILSEDVKRAVNSGKSR